MKNLMQGENKDIQIIKDFINIDISLNILVIISTVLIFLLLFSLKKYPIISTLNTISGFIPVLIHELGHAIICSLTLGKVKDIRVVITQHQQEKLGAQGYTNMEQTSWINKVLTTFAGYLACPALFFFGIYSIVTGKVMIFILILLLLFIYYFIKTKQKLVALLFISLIVISIINLNFSHIEFITLVFTISINIILGLMLGEMIQSLYITFISTFINKSDSWDGAQLRDLTFIPMFIWYTLWMIFDIIIIYKSVIMIEVI